MFSNKLDVKLNVSTKMLKWNFWNDFRTNVAIKVHSHKYEQQKNQ